MDNNLYLIHEEDYIKHIDEKVLLYSFVKQLTHHIAKLKPTCENENLIKMAKYYETSAENLFSFWGIPKSCLLYTSRSNREMDEGTSFRHGGVQPEYDVHSGQPTDQ